jgi:hypothetical protein
MCATHSAAISVALVADLEPWPWPRTKLAPAIGGVGGGEGEETAGGNGLLLANDGAGNQKRGGGGGRRKWRKLMGVPHTAPITVFYT